MPLDTSLNSDAMSVEDNNATVDQLNKKWYDDEHLKKENDKCSDEEWYLDWEGRNIFTGRYNRFDESPHLDQDDTCTYEGVDESEFCSPDEEHLQFNPEKPFNANKEIRRSPSDKSTSLPNGFLCNKSDRKHGRNKDISGSLDTDELSPSQMPLEILEQQIQLQSRGVPESNRQKTTANNYSNRSQSENGPTLIDAPIIDNSQAIMNEIPIPKIKIRRKYEIIHELKNKKSKNSIKYKPNNVIFPSRNSKIPVHKLTLRKKSHGEYERSKYSEGLTKDKPNDNSIFRFGHGLSSRISQANFFHNNRDTELRNANFGGGDDHMPCGTPNKNKTYASRHFLSPPVNHKSSKPSHPSGPLPSILERSKKCTDVQRQYKRRSPIYQGQENGIDCIPDGFSGSSVLKNSLQVPSTESDHGQPNKSGMNL